MRTVCPVLAAIPVGCMAQCIYNDMTSGLRSDFADKANQCRALGAECALTGVTVGGIESCEAFGMSCCPATTSTTYAKDLCSTIISFDKCNAACNAVFDQRSTSYSSWFKCKVNDASCCDGPFVVSEAFGLASSATVVAAVVASSGSD